MINKLKLIDIFWKTHQSEDDRPFVLLHHLDAEEERYGKGAGGDANGEQREDGAADALLTLILLAGYCEEKKNGKKEKDDC